MLGVAAPAGPQAAQEPRPGAAAPTSEGSPAPDPEAGTETDAVDQPNSSFSGNTFPPAPYDDRDCEPDTPLVDDQATPAARCLARQLDTWQAEGTFGVGQQINTSSQLYAEPITDLGPQSVAVVGFDVEELEKGQEFGFDTPPLDRLLQLASEGVVLTASWHTPNPSSRADSFDKSFQDLWALMNENRQEAGRFWTDFDAKLELFRIIQTGDGGRFSPAAVIFRPLHEANGDWFWWAQGADPNAYRALYSAMQERAADRGIHNLVWGYSANAKNDERLLDPVELLPDQVDLVGIDSYEQVVPGQTQAEQIDLTGIGELAARAPRLAITEVGPHGSADGDWDPRVIVRSAQAYGVRPVYALLWFDDGNASDGYSGIKQLSSLRTGPDWLRTCDRGVCPLA